jgi:prepilin-type N-terminal cleavage/methylation domain-containing protein
MTDERGFTLIEVLMAATLLLVAVVAMSTTFDYSRRLVTSSEAVNVASHRAEAEMEELRSVDFDALALPATVAHVADPEHPDYYAGSGSYQWDQGSTGPQNEPLVVDAVKSEVSHTEPWTDGQSRLEGDVYRYVTQVAGSDGDAKRLTVVVTVEGSDLKEPVLISSIVAAEELEP